MGVNLSWAALRAAGFVAMAQAAGAVLCLALLAGLPPGVRTWTARWGRVAAWAALVATLLHYLLEAGHMAGAFSGVLDTGLQQYAATTPAARVALARVAGLVLIGALLGRAGRAGSAGALAGVLLVVVSFALTGHTRTSPERWLLAPMVVLHVAVVAFWFGALLPLARTAREAPAAVAAGVVIRFSRIAITLVPLILVAGLVLASALLPGPAALIEPYGRGLVAKLMAFAVLMGLAALNKWRLGPALARDVPVLRARFARAAQAEWGIIAAVLAGTALLTAFFSPAG